MTVGDKVELAGVMKKSRVWECRRVGNKTCWVEFAWTRSDKNCMALESVRSSTWLFKKESCAHGQQRAAGRLGDHPTYSCGFTQASTCVHTAVYFNIIQLGGPVGLCTPIHVQNADLTTWQREHWTSMRRARGRPPANCTHRTLIDGNHGILTCMYMTTL